MSSLSRNILNVFGTYISLIICKPIYFNTFITPFHDTYLFSIPILNLITSTIRVKENTYNLHTMI